MDRDILSNMAAGNLNHVQRAIARKQSAKRLCHKAETLKETARDLRADSDGYRADSQWLKKVARYGQKKALGLVRKSNEFSFKSQAEQFRAGLLPESRERALIETMGYVTEGVQF